MSSKVSASSSPHLTKTIYKDDPTERYHDLEKGVAFSLSDGPRLFKTDAGDAALWEAYLENIPEHRRQYYNCRHCKDFITRYGGLVTIDATGIQRPAIWNISDPPPFFTASVSALYRLVKKAKVVGVFSSSERILGTPSNSVTRDLSKFGGGLETTTWTHLSVTNPRPHSNPYQLMAEKVEDYKMVCRALADYSLDTALQAARALKSDALYRSEKATEVAEWFYKLHCQVRDMPERRRNLTWLAVADAPVGFCHIRSGIIGTLLDDIQAGLKFDAIAARWKEKLNPLQYQRPTAAPKAGAIDRAEKLFAEMGLERSLHRRYATLDDVQVKLWVPRELPERYHMTGPGVFTHLRQPTYRNEANPNELELPTTKMTWQKFQRTVLPDVYEMEIFVIGRHQGFYGLLTAEYPDTPPILQWDGLEGFPRNSCSHFYYTVGSLPKRWGINAGYNKVTCIFPSVAHWQKPDRFKNQRYQIHFAIADCRDTNPCTLGLFPECLKAELHSVRSVIEAHSNQAKASGAEHGSANGLSMSEANGVMVRVRTLHGYASYQLDRLE